MNGRAEGDRMFWDNVAGADFKRQFTAESYRQFFLDAGYSDVRVSPAVSAPAACICTLF
jgi:hypothetical protein